MRVNTKYINPTRGTPSALEDGPLVEVMYLVFTGSLSLSRFSPFLGVGGGGGWVDDFFLFLKMCPVYCGYSIICINRH